MDAEVKAVCAEATASAPSPAATAEKHAPVLTLTVPRRVAPVAVLCVSGTSVSAVPPPKAA